MGAFSQGERLGFFVVFDLAIDQADNLITFLFFFEERVISLDIIFDFDIVDGQILAFFRLNLIEGDEFRTVSGHFKLSIIRIGLFRLWPRPHQGDGDKDSSAFRADDGVFAEIIEFGAAALALALSTEVVLGHGDNPCSLAIIGLGLVGLGAPVK
jgi:hypothetical protein